MKIFSPVLKRIWKAWNLRVTVMLSLVLQIVLMVLGNRRKYNYRFWMKFVLWCVYLSADSIATVSLGIISDNLADLFENHAGYILDPNIELTAFWAPFLLLHLGGPDTITSYALEDNELWLRHFLGLIVQTGVVIYVLSMAWTGSYLSFLYILMLFAGLIKYGERILSLWNASSEKLRQKFKRVHKKDEDEVGEKFRNQYGSKAAEGYIVGTDMITLDFPVDLSGVCGNNDNNNSASDENRLVIADSLHRVTMSLFSDTILTSTIKETTHYLFKNMSVENAFKIIELETAFTFDSLYTKAPLLYTPLGLLLHIVTFFLTLLVLLLFTFLSRHHKHKYSKIDIFVTFGLLIGAIVLEIYAALVLLSSDRAIVWFWNHNKISNWRIPSYFQPPKGPRWSNKMAQYSLLSFSMKEKTLPCLNILKTLRCLDILKLFNIDKMLEESLYVTYKEVPEEFKKLVFQNSKDKAAKRTRGTENPKPDDPAATEEAAPPGTTQVEESTSSRKSEGIPNFEEDLSKGILFWHFVTELSYYIDKSDMEKEKQWNGELKKKIKLMKKISRYMMYLLVNHPSVLSIGMSTISFEEEADILAETFLKIRSEKSLKKTETFRKLCEPGFGDNNKGVLRYAHSYMKKMSEPEKLIEKWEDIGRDWSDLLAYAACKCKGRLHAQNLRFGGELLTHVWLLMAQFGLTEHFQRSEKLQIARLVSE